MRQLYSLPFFLLPLLAGCVGPGSNQVKFESAESLAKKQWQACSYFPSVELVEITAQGEVMVRDLHYSSPPIDFQRCLARLAYRQVMSGKRNAQSLIRDAYFTDSKPVREYLFKPSGHFPVAVDRFSPNQSVYFFFVMDAPSVVPVRISFDWSSPSGKSFRTPPRPIRIKGAAARRWSFEKFNLPSDATGRWSARLFIENIDAGEYFFTVE